VDLEARLLGVADPADRALIGLVFAVIQLMRFQMALGQESERAHGVVALERSIWGPRASCSIELFG
jgi:hypothetical protein